jgi:hypothetical protein
MCKQYKSRIDAMIKTMGLIEQYVLCPDTSVKTSKSNRVLNDRRIDDIKAGRQRADRPVKQKRKATTAGKFTREKSSQQPS